MTRFIESRILFIILCLLFRGVLDISYTIFVSHNYEYSGFSFDFLISSYLLSWLIYISCLTMTPHLLNRVSDYFIASFLLTIVGPLSSLVGLTNAGFYPLMVTAATLFFFSVFQYGEFLSKFMPLPRVASLKEGRIASILISFTAVLFLTFWYFYSGATRYFNLNILKVYDFRDASAELANIGLFSYFNNWVFGVFSIFLMSYSLFKRQYFIFILLFIFQIFFFGVSNHKSVLFYPIMIFSLWFYFKRTRAISVMPLGFIFILFSCLLFYFAFDYVIAGSLFIRRVFYVPAKLTLDYFAFFSVNDSIWWSNSIFSKFIEYPYEVSVSELIGKYNGTDASANNGFISSGYAHAQLLGVIVYSLIFSYFLKLLDAMVIRSDVPIWLALCMTIVPLRAALISSDLFTTMLTHGLAVSLFLILLFRKPLHPHIPG